MKYAWLGARPDFLVVDNFKEMPFGIGEIRCPYSKKDVSIDDACNDKKFFLEKVNGKFQLKKKHNYFYQIQGCMATLNVSWCDFVVLTIVDVHIERINFDKDV